MAETQVLGIDDVEMRQNDQLFRDDEITSLEEKLTSSSNHEQELKTKNSIATILSQALVADDQETLDWAFMQKDQALIL